MIPEAPETVETASDSQETPAVEAPPEEEAETFSRAYVEKLREEAAEARVRAKRTTEAEARLRDLAIAHAVQGILTEPRDFVWDDAYADDHGWPDPDKITAAATALVDRSPHLGRPRGNVGLGQHGSTSGDVDLAGMLRLGA